MNLSRSWANSIEWQEDFSGGQSPKDSIIQWSHSPSDPGTESGDFIIYGSAESGTAYGITIKMVGSNPTMLGRSLGCVMIGVMPDEGLEEAIFSLRDILEFYNRKPVVLRPARLAPKAIEATIGDKKKRPDLVITE